MPDEPSIPEPDYSDPLTVGQDKLVAAIKALPLIEAKGVPVEPERRGDIEQTILNAINRLGVAVVVMEAISATVEDPEANDGLVEVEYVVEAVENVTVNRPTEPLAEDQDAPVAVTALQVMTQIVNGLRGTPSGLLNARHPLGQWLVDQQAIRRIPHKTLSAYQTIFHVGISLTAAQ